MVSIFSSERYLTRTMKLLLSLVLAVTALSSAAAASPPGAVAAWDPASSESRGDSVAILDTVGTNALIVGPNSGGSIVDDPMGGGKRVLKFAGVNGGKINSAVPLVGEADWCIRMRVMPLEGGEKAQTLLDMIQVELRLDVSLEQLSLIVFPDPGKGRPVTVSVSLPKDRWSDVVASIKGRELTLRVGEEKATLEIPESGLLAPFKLPFKLGSRGTKGVRPFTGMVSDISFGKPN
jgi:hypothetical protein